MLDFQWIEGLRFKQIHAILLVCVYLTKGNSVVKNVLISLFFLTIVWIILLNELSLFSILSGLFASGICLLLFRKFMPLQPIGRLRFSRIALYPFSLLVMIFIEGFLLIRTIFSRADVRKSEIKTKLKHDFLKTILVHSITLTPGSIVADLTEGKMIILSLSTTDAETTRRTLQNITDRMERRLHRAE